MKKNMTTKLLVLLLALVLVTTAFVGGTFAKYTASGSAEDKARVAKWGVTLKVEGNDVMFAKQYGADGKAGEASDSDLIVKSTESEVLAPGTSGTLATITIGGTTEVACAVTYTPTLTLGNWTVDGTSYCPIEFTVDNTKVTVANTTAEAVKTAVETAIKELSQSYVAPGGTVADTVTITWEWPQETDNAKDTALGKAANDGNAPSIELKLDVAVEQVFTAPAGN